ncbi:hypothetical protein [Roseicella aquatilis]|uniref:Uncharacterized protein n=1 Tax=Roseicella aquatilis TaxID=2527868 RepID=A0A4R4DBF8_9PROT|nr:hypothetical protein [Roseicella aquatilis]TCZ57148.1 hypothetical protein EXY23_18565 [Roseicella aquatilis]
MRPVLMLGLFATAWPALAQDAPPPLKPARDVAITYRAASSPVPGLDIQLRTLVSAATGRQRQENSGLVGITDPRAKRRLMFSMDRQDGLYGRVIEQPISDDEMSLEEVARDPDFRVTRHGTETVAGLSCTVWRVREAQEPEAEARELCLTADGLMLRSRAQKGGMRESIEAVSVEYAPLDPALFAPPAGWPVQR